MANGTQALGESPAYLVFGKKVSQKEFVLGLIQRALDEAERKEAASRGADLG